MENIGRGQWVNDIIIWGTCIKKLNINHGKCLICDLKIAFSYGSFMVISWSLLKFYSISCGLVGDWTSYHVKYNNNLYIISHDEKIPLKCHSPKIDLFVHGSLCYRASAPCRLMWQGLKDGPSIFNALWWCPAGRHFLFSQEVISKTQWVLMAGIIYTKTEYSGSTRQGSER